MKRSDFLKFMGLGSVSVPFAGLLKGRPEEIPQDPIEEYPHYAQDTYSITYRMTTEGDVVPVAERVVQCLVDEM